MTARQTFGIVFIFSFVFLALSASWLIFRFFAGGINSIFKEIMGQITLIVVLISSLTAFLSIRKLLEDIRHEIDEINEIEKTVRDFCRYEQLINPPEMDN